MEFTGERMIPAHNKEREIYMEHIARYDFASQFIVGKTVLDIACGSGYGANLLLKNGAKFVYGIDISDEAIAYCKKNYKNKNLQFNVGNVEKIPMNNESVDVIVSFETLEHVNEDAQNKFMIEINRILKKDGILLISTPNALVSPIGNKYHLKELSCSEFENYLKSNFKFVKIYFQSDIQASYIFSPEMMVDKQKNELLKINKIVKYAEGDAYFFIAVCSKQKYLEDILEEVCLFSDEERKILLREINVKNEIIKKSEKLVIERDNYIKELENRK